MTTKKTPNVPPLRQYAQDTKVSASTTKQQIEQLLVKRGADQFGTAFDAKKHVAMVLFTLDEGGQSRQIKIMLPVSGDGADQQSKAAWRALLLSLKAKLIAIDQGISTLEKEFFPDIVLPNGQTMAEHYGPQLEAAYKTLKMPALIPGLEQKG